MRKALLTLVFLAAGFAPAAASERFYDTDVSELLGEPGSIIRLYTNGTCTSAIAGTGVVGTGGTFAIPVTVAANSTTTFRATAADDADNTSACSTTSATYVSDQTAPGSPRSTISPAASRPRSSCRWAACSPSAARTY